jgi:hypothetical protein
MNTRARLLVLTAVIVLAVAGTVGYVVNARGQQGRAVAAAPKKAVTTMASVTSGPHIVFRSTAIGNDYGKVAVVALSNPAGPRAYAPVTCDRVYARSTESICLYSQPGLVTTYKAEVLGADWTVRRSLPLSGVPSRARLSPDSAYAATTTFVTGHDYNSPGTFSTETLVTNVSGGPSPSVNIESFALTVDGRPITAKNRNMWGVTFTPGDDVFYATAASGQKTWLVRGSLRAKTLTALREDAECPSLSPDGTRVAFKTRNGEPAGQWRIAVYDLASGKTTLLAEKHSVDDQIEWLDNQNVLYGLPRTGTGASASDVWTVAADGTGSSRIFIPDAWSPAVVR